MNPSWPKNHSLHVLWCVDVICEKVRDTQPVLSASTEKRFSDQISSVGMMTHCDRPTRFVKSERIRDRSGVKSLATL